MKLFIILFTLLFFIGGMTFHQELVNGNLLTVYTNFFKNIYIHHSIVIFIVLFFLLIIGFRVNKFHPSVKFHKKSFITFFQIISSAVLGFYFSLVLLFLLAILELNIFAVLFNTNPSILGVTTEKKLIAQSLKQTISSPQIITSENNQKEVIKAVALASAGKNTFYGNFIIKSVPTVLLLPVEKKDSAMFLVANTLIITQLHLSEMEAVSPYIGYHLVKRYFPQRQIKSYPRITTLNRDEYITFRKADAVNRIRKVESQIQNVVTSINETNPKLQRDRVTLTQVETAVDELKQQVNTSYTACLNEGIYINKVFQRSNSEVICKERVNDLEKKLEEEMKRVQSLTKTIQSNENRLKEYERYANLFAAQVKAAQNAAVMYPHEYGVFVPDSVIRIAIDTQRTDTLLDYLGTLSHEYLHYASFVSDNKSFSDVFFEEGLTEYYARQIITYDFQKNVNLGYPIFVKIIRQMMQVIPETELADIYFTKDQEGLETVLNRVYGDSFYEDTRYLFASLQYAADEDEVLALANEIMKNINGKPLTKKDLESSRSKF